MKFDFSGYFFKVLSKISFYFAFYSTNKLAYAVCYLKGVNLGKSIRFHGIPRINRKPGTKITIHSNCKFNSSFNSLPIGLTKRCALVTIHRNAEIIIGEKSGLSGVTIVAAQKVTIGKNVVIGAYTTIVDTDFHNPDPILRESSRPTNPVAIEDNVFIGFNCFVLKGVTIGENAVIGANSVVFSNIPPNCIAIGNPCKVLLQRKWGN